MAAITKDMRIGEILQIDTGCAPILMEAGMHCLGCPASAMETLAQACEVHGADADVIEAKLNEYFANNA